MFDTSKRQVVSLEGKVLLEKFYNLVETPKPTFEQITWNQMVVEAHGNVPHLYSWCKRTVVNSSWKRTNELRELALPPRIKADVLYFATWAEKIVLYEENRMVEAGKVLKCLVDKHNIKHI